MRTVTAAMLTIASLTLFVSAQSLPAQTCSGQASFALGPARVGGGAFLTETSTSLDVLVGVGLGRAFAEGNFSSIDYKNSKLNASLFGARTGYRYVVNVEKTIEVCPLVGASYRLGPKSETAAGIGEIAERVLVVGATIGGVAFQSPTLDISPFAAALYNVKRATITTNADAAPSWEDYPSVEVGAGFVLNRSFSIRPIVTLPMASRFSRVTYGVSIAVNFGSNP